MEFGLWFEPEMVNPDSDLYREHPDWILSAGGRVPLLHRNQLVLDLTAAGGLGVPLRPDRRDPRRVPDRLREVGPQPGPARGGQRARAAAPPRCTLRPTPSTHCSTTCVPAPDVAWESCAAGGGRIDLGVIERVQRFWTSDMTDALARQQIQRWTIQLVAPEYLGAHVSRPDLTPNRPDPPLDFRAATAFFGAFGIEWDLTAAGEEDLDRLAGWRTLHKRLRPLLHSGRAIRIPIEDPAQQAHGVVAQDRGSAIVVPRAAR